MSRFKVGQEVVCIKKGLWTRSDGVKLEGPKFNEIVTIHSIHYDEIFYSSTGTALMLSEYGSRKFKSIHFQLIITDSELASELESITQKVTI